jgi:polar amino acid transport system substrate-binding protein
MQLFRRLFAVGLLSAALACAGSGVRAPGAAAPLRVGISPNYPPIAFRAEGKLAGVEVDLAHELGRSLGRRVRFVELDRDGLIPALESDEVDVVMSGMSITPEREARVLFAQPYMRVGQLVLIRAADLPRFGPRAALRRGGARVGYVRATTGAEYVARELLRAEAQAFESVDEGVLALRTHRIDFFVHDAPSIWSISLAPGERDLMGLYQPLTEEFLAWAVSRNDPELKTRLDAVLDGWRAEGRLDPILDRWIPVRVEVR